MEDLYLVLTKYQKYHDGTEKKLFLSRFYCGIDYDFLQEKDLLLEENLDNEFILNLRKNLDRIENILIDVLYHELNKFHRTDLSRKFWQEILHLWLQQVLQQVYCKYYRVKYMLEHIDKSTYHLHIPILNKNGYRNIADVTECTFECLGERYDFQLWSRVIERLCDGYDFISLHDVVYDAPPMGVYETTLRDLKNWDNYFSNYRGNRVKLFFSALKQGELGRSINLVQRLWKEFTSDPLKSECYLYYAGFSSAAFNHILNESKGKIQPLPHAIAKKSYQYDGAIPRNIELRSEVLGNVINRIDILPNEEKDIVKITLQEIPLCYLELFPSIRKQYCNYLLPNIKYIITQHGAYMNTVFLFYLTEMRSRFECETRGHQHGGDYQLLNLPFIQDINIVDKFYCWGKINDPKFVESAPSKFTEYSHEDVSSPSEQILFVGSGFYHPYLFRGVVDYDIEMRFSMRCEFIDNLNHNVKKVLRIREDHEFGWEIGKSMKRKFPDLQYDDKSKDFLFEIKNSVLCIAEYFGTTWLEILAINKPIIIFFEGYDYENHEYSYRQSETGYLDLLKEAGILYDNPREAAGTVNRIYHDIDSWWNDLQRREVVQTIRKRYWNDFGDADVWWEKEILSLVNVQ